MMFFPIWIATLYAWHPLQQYNEVFMQKEDCLSFVENAKNKFPDREIYGICYEAKAVVDVPKDVTP